MRISDWSSDVCSSDLVAEATSEEMGGIGAMLRHKRVLAASLIGTAVEFYDFYIYATAASLVFGPLFFPASSPSAQRSEEHTSELQSLMRLSYAVFCLTKKIHT